MSSLSLWRISDVMLTQAKHDADAAELMHALRAAACIAILALSPSARDQVDCLACLTQSLQVASLLPHHMLHQTGRSKLVHAAAPAQLMHQVCNASPGLHNAQVV